MWRPRNTHTHTTYRLGRQSKAYSLSPHLLPANAAGLQAGFISQNDTSTHTHFSHKHPDTPTFHLLRLTKVWRGTCCGGTPMPNSQRSDFNMFNTDKVINLFKEAGGVGLFCTLLCQGFNGSLEKISELEEARPVGQSGGTHKDKWSTQGLTKTKIQKQSLETAQVNMCQQLQANQQNTNTHTALAGQCYYNGVWVTYDMDACCNTLSSA